MKYNRLTKRIANDEEAFLFHSSLHEGIERLAELEDKIESGELISTKQVGDTEIEFFVNHNENVRKNIAQDIFSWIYKNLVNLNFITGNVEINLSALNNFAKTYGVDVFDIFKQGEKQ